MFCTTGGYNSSYGGGRNQAGNDKFNFTRVNMVANYYKPGPATQPGKVSYRIVNPGYRNTVEDYGEWYVAGNVVEGNPTVTDDNWNGGVQPSGGDAHLSIIKREKPWPAMPIRQQTAREAYEAVLEGAGATLPRRDAVDERIVAEVRGGYATYEGKSYKKSKRVADASKPCGIIDTPSDVGGWPVLRSASAPVDSDHDGMPDEWETAFGLDPENPADRNKVAPDGYTYLEKYLNALCGE